MQTWGPVYRRLRDQRRFRAYFGKHGQIPGANDFVFRAYVLVFQNVLGWTQDDPTSAPAFGPQQQLFDKGAVVLGITAAAYQIQQPLPSNLMAYPPSTNSGRRDLFSLFIRHLDDEKITPDQTVMQLPVIGAVANVQAQVQADPLTGDGQEDDFMAGEIVVPPSSGFAVVVKNLQPSTDAIFFPNDMPAPTVHVVFHAVIPRG